MADCIITGKILSQNGSAAQGTISLHPANAGHVIRKTPDVEVGSLEIQTSAMTGSLTVEQGVWAIAVRPHGKNDPDFPTLTTVVDLQTLTTIDWDDIYAGVATYIPPPPESTAVRAEAAATDAEAAATRAEAVGDTNDTIMAGVVNDPASATSGALSATYAKKGDAASSSVPAQLWDLMDRLDRATQDVVLAFSGDSTMANAGATPTTGNWPWQLANKIAAAYPEWTVTWQHKTDLADTYQPLTTIQTGTNGRTLTVYNWSQSGAQTGVGMTSEAVLHVAYPVAPDLLVIGTGHNDSGAMATEANRVGHRAVVRDAIDLLSGHYPQTKIVWAIPNPRRATDASYAAVLETHREHQKQAGRLGIGVMNLARAWFDRPGGYDDLLPPADNTHPNDAGSGVLATEAWALLSAAKKSGPAVTQHLRRPLSADPILVPAIPGLAKTGTPEVAFQAGYLGAVGVAFDPAVDEAWQCGGLVQIPATWVRVGGQILWCPQTNGAGDVRFKVEYLRANHAGSGTTMPVSTFGGIFTATVAATQQGRTQRTGFVWDFPPHVPAAAAHVGDELTAPFVPLQFRITRLGSDVADTFTGDALVYGVQLYRRG